MVNQKQPHTNATHMHPAGDKPSQFNTLQRLINIQQTNVALGLGLYIAY